MLFTLNITLPSRQQRSFAAPRLKNTNNIPFIVQLVLSHHTEADIDKTPSKIPNLPTCRGWLQTHIHKHKNSTIQTSATLFSSRNEWHVTNTTTQKTNNRRKRTKPYPQQRQHMQKEPHQQPKQHIETSAAQCCFAFALCALCLQHFFGYCICFIYTATAAVVTGWPQPPLRDVSASNRNIAEIAEEKSRVVIKVIPDIA